MKRSVIFVFLCVVLISTSSYATKGIGIGVHAGYLFSYGDVIHVPYVEIDRLPMIGVHVNISSIPIIEVSNSVEFAWGSYKEVRADEFGNFLGVFDLGYKQLSINSTISYTFDISRVKPYIGGRIGFSGLLYSGSVRGAGNEQFTPDDETAFSFGGIGGVLLTFPSLPFSIFAETQYIWLQTDPNHSEYTSLLGGVTFRL